ncbi:hypothetical protein GCM10007940_40700 [Portibacter lacus]|uniref:Secretion system C-terminal sorting domain-containing protein n=2 Tax=Portibacter lacus TaxID=1099794 RepID=A0AA37WHJ8_9BACT|nr:hypothetical protein GCM10007940_40700 [Portibacter lacus]
MFNFAFSQGNPPCLDPDATVAGECGVSFDLCIDYQALPQSGIVDIDVTSNDILGLFNSCDLELISDNPEYMAEHGVVTKINDNGNCKFRYALTDLNYVGTDTFSYLLNYINPCEPLPTDCNGQGKIWTMTSNYYGPDNAAVIVKAKQGPNLVPVDTVFNLMYGTSFFVDGTHLGPNQTEWAFGFYGNGDLNSPIFEYARVHTSCSVWIFGQDFGIFRPISGCIASKNDKSDCVIYENKEAYQNTGKRAEQVNQFTVDTTDVIVYILPFGNLPIDFTYMWGRAQETNNLIAWEIATVINEEYMFLQYSNDGINWENLTKYRDLKAGNFDFLHENIESATTYYRFKMISTEGGESFSRSINVHNKNMKTKDVDIYPNPTADVIHFASEEKIEYIEIYDLSGRLISLKNIGANSVQLSKSELEVSGGIFIAAVYLENNFKVLRKVTFL